VKDVPIMYITMGPNYMEKNIKQMWDDIGKNLVEFDSVKKRYHITGHKTHIFLFFTFLVYHMLVTLI
jgi:hypothetical protein